MRLQDVLNYNPQQAELAKYPERIETNGRHLSCEYRFAPGEDHDGITVRVPVQEAGAVSGEAFQWLVPGLLKEKITTMVKSLPKEVRKQLVPVNETVQIILDHMPAQSGTSLKTALSRFIRRRWGFEIPAAVWDESQLPDYLRMRIAVTDEKGRTLRAARDTRVLQTCNAAAPPSDAFNQARRKWERAPVETWDFGDLPETITLHGNGGQQWTAYPALQKHNAEIVLTALDEFGLARRIHREGVQALLLKHIGHEKKYLQKNLALPYSSDPACRYFGGRRILEEQLTARVLEEHLAKDIRTAAEFDKAVEFLHTEAIAAWGQRKKRELLKVIEAYQNLRLQLADLERIHPRNVALHSFINELRSILQQLVPDNFVALYGDERLAQLPRYLKGMAVRAERAVVDLEKDRQKVNLISAYMKRLHEWVRQLAPDSSAQKRAAIEDFFWMLEEYRIAVFAPEVKTACPVSAKRLDALITRIEELV